MTCPKSLALFAVLCAVSSATPVQEHQSETGNSSLEINYRLPKNTSPAEYSLTFIPDIGGAFSFEGEAVVKFSIHERTSYVALHSKNLTLQENATRLILDTGDAITPVSHEYHNVTDILSIHFAKSLDVGVYTLSIEFSGDLSDDMYGFYKTKYKNAQENTVWLAATQFEPTHARRAFPCWDEPALKATFNVSVKHYPNYTAISNMPVRYKSDIDETDGKVWTHFDKTPVMSTYLVAFVVADFVNVSINNGTMNAWCRKELLPDLGYACNISVQAIVALEDYTNSSDRVPKLDHVLLPQHPTGAMENWGMITYPERNFASKPDETSAEQLYTISETVIHEVAHQWFGNVVSPKWWSHVWLNEGLASYFQYYILGKIHREDSRISNYFVTHVVQNSLWTDYQWHLNPIDADMKTPEEITRAFSGVIYRKAPSVLHMLSNIISPKVFQKGIVRYINAYAYNAADSDCLWRELQTALDQSDVSHSEFNVKEVMDTWIKQKRYPLVYVTRNYSTGAMKLVQRDFGTIDVYEPYDRDALKDDDEQYEWWVPINYATETNPDFSHLGPTHWLKPEKNLTIDGIGVEGWVIVNTQQSGYYRVTYDDVNWRRIAQQLRSENFRQIHILNRAQIINDISGLVTYDEVDPSIFLEVVTYLSQETNYPPWNSLFRFLNDIEHVLQFPPAEPIRSFILNAMDNMIKHVGFEEHVQDNPLTLMQRHEVLQWACNLGHVECKQIATGKFMRHLENPDANKISPNEKKWVLGQAMRSANESDWNKAFSLCVENPSEDAFHTLSNTENPKLLMKYLNVAISDDTTISGKLKNLMIFYGVTPDKLTEPLVDVLLNFYEQNWSEIIERHKYAQLDFYDILYKVYSEEQLEKGKKLCIRKNDEHCGVAMFWERKLRRMKTTNETNQKWTKLITSKSFLIS